MGRSLSLSLGVSLSYPKTTKFGKALWKVQQQVGCCIQQPRAFGPAWMIGPNRSPVVNHLFQEWLKDLINRCLVPTNSQSQRWRTDPLTDRKALIAAVLLMTTSLVNVGHAQDYDLVIANGRVMDPETRYDAIANVGITDGRVAAITEGPITGKQTIVAAGHVVAPGFIDLHAHGQNLGDYRMQAMQGVTTMLELESGVLPIASWY